MKKVYLFLLLLILFSANPVMAATKSSAVAPKTAWKPEAPNGYKSITWASAPGIASYYKIPPNNGALDYLTRIYLPQNQIGFITATSTPVDINEPNSNSNTSASDINAKTISSYPNFSFQRIGAESAKTLKPSFKFLWDAPFFNMKSPASDLSMATKYSNGTSTIITAGSRSVPDMGLSRRMLIVNNDAGTAMIKNFDEQTFLDSKNGDLALEGFSPIVPKGDGNGASASRLFLGVSKDGREVVVYCSRLATINEASRALEDAGIPFENQLQADGGGSTACGYNLPGQFFVEPIRTLPLLMGAETLVARGSVSGDVLNVRSGPSTKNSIVTKLKKGATVRAYEEKNGWYRIGDGQWVSKTLIKTTN